MEVIAPFFTSKVFLAFLALIFIFNMVRRYNKKARRRNSDSRGRLKDHIRERQLSQWEQDDGEDK